MGGTGAAVRIRVVALPALPGTVGHPDRLVSAQAANVVLYVALAVIVAGSAAPLRWGAVAVLVVCVALDGRQWVIARRRRRDGL